MRIRILEPLAEIKQKKMKVCAYARVSTDSRKQEDSLENQQETYEQLIRSNPEYEFAGVYSDQGISGYCEKRPGLQEMIRKAKAGEIDLIITKSISRFARNTVTVLKVVRELKGLGVGTFFEEQKINTLSRDGEMMLAVLSSFAQEESQSMSENNKWTIRKKFEQGEVMINTERLLGYDKDEYGGLSINVKEALIVAFLYDKTLFGVGCSRLKNLLNDFGVKSVTGGEWHEGSIRGVLINEKYKWDCHLQKTFTLENKRNQTRQNRGEVQSYYITDNHPAIVSADLWDRVQEERKCRKKESNIGSDGTAKYQNRYPLSGMLVCPHCGKNLWRRQVHKKRIQWWCSTYIEKGKEACRGIRVEDTEVQKQSITEPTVIEEVELNGKKYYRYTSKAEFGNQCQQRPECAEAADGSVLSGINRPRRTAIKL